MFLTIACVWEQKELFKKRALTEEEEIYEEHFKRITTPNSNTDCSALSHLKSGEAK